jgi:hypothetical protein
MTSLRRGSLRRPTASVSARMHLHLSQPVRDVPGHVIRRRVGVNAVQHRRQAPLLTAPRAGVRASMFVGSLGSPVGYGLSAAIRAQQQRLAGPRRRGGSHIPCQPQADPGRGSRHDPARGRLAPSEPDGPRRRARPAEPRTRRVTPQRPVLPPPELAVARTEDVARSTAPTWGCRMGEVPRGQETASMPSTTTAHNFCYVDSDVPAPG